MISAGRASRSGGQARDRWEATRLRHRRLVPNAPGRGPRSRRWAAIQAGDWEALAKFPSTVGVLGRVAGRDDPGA